MKHANFLGGAIAIALASLGAHAADRPAAGTASSNQATWSARNAGASSTEELRDAQELVRDAVQTVQHMKADPDLTGVLRDARGVFVVPHYGRGALGVGFQGGEGVLVTRRGQRFGSPAFYNLGGVSVGVQAGGSGGEVAFLLMTDRAVRDFRSGKNFSLNADAGLTIARYSERGQVSGGKVQDVVVWSGTQGAYAGASVGITDVTTDEEANRAYYGRADVTPSQVLAGTVANPHSDVLGRVLAL